MSPNSLRRKDAMERVQTTPLCPCITSNIIEQPTVSVTGCS